MTKCHLWSTSETPLKWCFACYGCNADVVRPPALTYRLLVMGNSGLPLSAYCVLKLLFGILTLHMLKLRFINRERTEDCSPLTVSGWVSDEWLTFLGLYVSQQNSFVRFGSNFNGLNLEYK